MKNIRMRIARKGKKMSQEELAKITGVARQTIGSIENGKINPSLRLCNKICGVLNVSLNDIFWDNN